jgi:hypothetical protein
MLSGSTILVCGDAGAARRPMLARQDLHVVWTDSVTGARAMIGHVRPALCIVAPGALAEDARALVREARKRGGPPCAVLLPEARLASDEGHWYALGATEVVDQGEAGALLDVVSAYTGAAFAVEPRSPLDVAVDVRIAGEALAGRTVDISASGVCIEGVGRPEIGTLARLELALDTETVLWGRVARTWTTVDGVDQTAVRFRSLTEVQTEELRRLVRLQLSKEARRTIEPTQLFADVELLDDAGVPLRPDDFDDAAGSDAADLDRLAAAMRGESYGDDGWARALADRLGPLEREGVREDAPSWLRRTLGIRAALARHAHEHPQAPPPDLLVVRAYDCFETLGAVAPEQDGLTQVQIGAIRAALLGAVQGAWGNHRPEAGAPIRTRPQPAAINA